LYLQKNIYVKCIYHSQKVHEVYNIFEILILINKISNPISELD